MNKNPVCHENDSGQALVLVALFLLGLIAMLALVLDGGNIYLQRRRMQNAADAGAMAGVRVLALNGTSASARAAAQEYAVTRNGAHSADVIIDASSITVVAYRTVPLTFARVLGLNQSTVSARARAIFGPSSQTGGVAPIAIRDFDFLFNVPYTIWDDTKDLDPTSGNISGGYRGWLNIPCVYPLDCGDAGASETKTWMQSGYNGLTRINTWIRGTSGTKAAVIAEASVGQLLKIAVFTEIQNKYTNKSYYYVVKFAAFRVTRVYASGNPKGIQGYFQYYVTPGPPDGEEDGGMRSIALSQ